MPNNIVPSPEPTVKPAPERTSRVVSLCDPAGRYRSYSTQAASPEEAAEEVLLVTCGKTRPPLAPETVEVDGEPFRVDEWAEARVFVIPLSGEGKERLRAERALFHLRAADNALSALAAAASNPNDARQARYDAASVCDVAARVRSLAARAK